MDNLFLLFLGTLVPTTILCFPNGAPLQACQDLLPQHPFPVARSVSPYQLVIDPISRDGKTVGLKISVENSATGQLREFKTLAGFLLQVRENKSGKFVGKLSSSRGISKHACNNRASLTHTDNGQKAINSLQFAWEPLPAELSGPMEVRVYATFVKTAEEYWTPVASPPIVINS